MVPKEQLGPNELLYKEVVDSKGEPIGKVVNLTQNGSGYFDLFGVEIYESVAHRIHIDGRGLCPHLFLDTGLIEEVDIMIRLKQRIEELRSSIE